VEPAKAGVTPAAPIVLALKVPVGADTVLDEHDLAEFTALATREGWTQDEAQAFVGEQVQAAQERHARLLTETKAHPEVGGEALAGSQQRARAVLDRFSPANTPDGEALRRGLTKTGAANWAPLVAMLSRIGKAMGEDTPGSGLGSAAKVERTQADVLYGEAKAS
jgi:hypothetical protein